MQRPAFAALLLQLRQATGLTQEELASRAQVGVRTIRDLESGRATRPQRSTVDLLAGALGLAGASRARFEAASRGRPVSYGSLPRIEPLIGRDQDVAGVAALLDVAGLVTIVGLAGVGKVAVAATVTNTIVDRFPGGVGAIRVTDASTEAEVLTSTVNCLGASHVDELAVRLADEPALVLVAGANRSPVAAAAAIARLRQRTTVRILVTSLHPLGLPSEHQWALGPLEVPPPDATGAAVFDYPATRLFLDRLRLVRQHPVDEADAAVLGALVRRLGGLPYALELAAARGRVLDLAEILARASSEQPTDATGETVRAAVYASWDLLTPLEQTCLCWLSVFQWRWSMEMAEELLAADGSALGGDVLTVVDRLVGLGLVRARTDSPILRLSLFDAVRRVALEEAARRGFLAAARDQHAMVIARLCARAAEPAASDLAETLDKYLAPEVQAAAKHLAASALVPRQRSAPRVDSDLREGVVRWLEERGLAP